jgi:dihydropteroate synthase
MNEMRVEQDSKIDPPLVVRGHSFAWGARTYVMGIINVTPDSFSGDGVGGNVQAAVEQAKRFAADGADILDIGGESTRPGSARVSADEEMARVLPVIEACARAVDLPISVDTSKAAVAKAALDAGAGIVNDVWGLHGDNELAGVCAAAACPVVLMHNRRTPPAATQVGRLGGHYAGLVYGNLMQEIITELRESIAIAIAAGVASERIIVDPGLGFAKTAEHNLEVMRRLGELRVLGHPILIGPSRKSTIGLVLGLPVEQRLEGTAALVALGIAAGADIVRVHDVREMARVARMSDAVVRGWTRP